MTTKFTVQVTVDPKGAVTGAKQVSGALDRVKGKADSTSSAMRALGGLLSLRFIGQGIGGIVAMADEFQNLENRLRAVIPNTRDLVEVQDALVKSALETRSSMADVGQIYTRLLLSANELGQSQEQLITFTTRLNKAIILSGTSAQEAKAGLTQLSQGLASGTLRGDELRSVLEQLPKVADVIAKGMGVTRGELRLLGLQGKITAQEVLGAFEAQGKAIDDAFEETIPTIGQSLQVLNTTVAAGVDSWSDYYDALNKISAIVSKVSEGFDGFRGRVTETEVEARKFGQIGQQVNSTTREINKLKESLGEGGLTFASQSQVDRIDFLQEKLRKLKDSAKEATQGQTNEEKADITIAAKAAIAAGVNLKKVLENVKGPQERFAANQASLNQLLAEGKITQLEYNSTLARYQSTIARLSNDSALTSIEKTAKGISNANDLLRTKITFGEDQAELLRVTQSLDARGIEITDLQRESLLKLLTTKRELTELDAQRAVEETDAADLAAEQERIALVLEHQSDAWGGLTDRMNEYALEAANLRQVGADITDAFANQATNAITKFVTTGKGSMKEFATAVLADIARIIARLLVMNAVSSLGGGVGGAAVSLGGAVAGGRAHGGPVNKDKSYLVGEKGPELFTPGSNGSITTNEKTMGGQAPAAPPQVNVQVVNVQDPSLIPAAISDGDSDDAIINVLSRNPEAVKSIIQG